jgi:putative nucleotidyltransferase with HDIG domain
MAPPEGVRIAELVATLSYAADLGLGQPLEHCLRQSVIARGLAELSGASPEERAATYYVGMLVNSYCHADASEQARWFGDDIEAKSGGYDVLTFSTPQMVAQLLRLVGGHGTPRERATRLATLPTAGAREFQRWLLTHTTLSSEFAARIGLDPAVETACRHAYEQWDGKGPRGIRGEEISASSRCVAIASAVDVLARRYGVRAAVDAVRKSSGRIFDPRLAEVFAANAADLLAEADVAADWDAIVAAEPGSVRVVAGGDLDDALEAMADLVDLKSPYFAGHSRGVANLAAAAAADAGLGASDQRTIRRAGLLHDLGRLGVSNGVWEKPGPLTDVERDRAHQHPYLTDRMLQRIPALQASREIAARHHERLDGSGYPRGINGSQLTLPDRILAAADVYHAMTEPRPHRDVLDPARAERELTAEARSGRLDGDAVASVLRAAGRRAPARRAGPGGLSPREVEVLTLLARGLTTKEIARRLGTSPKTCANHVEHIYTKLGIGSRAEATLFATRHGLVGTFETAARR